jgi:hypothetical protein
VYKTTIPLYFDIFLDESPIPSPTPLEQGNSAEELVVEPTTLYTTSKEPTTPSSN